MCNVKAESQLENNLPTRVRERERERNRQKDRQRERKRVRERERREESIERERERGGERERVCRSPPTPPPLWQQPCHLNFDLGVCLIWACRTPKPSTINSQP